MLLRKERGAIQKGLNLDDLKSLDIPLFSDSLYKSAELCIKKSLDFIQRAKQCYADAEKRLEATIIPTLSLSCSNTSIKSLKESFLHSGRLDAEYYQEKYQAYETTILSAKQGYTFVKNEFEPVKEKCTRNQESYNYVEIGDVDVGTGSVSFNAICTENLPDNAKILTRADNLLVSGAFTVLRESGDYPEEVLQVLLRTSMYRDWLLRFNVGTSYPVIKDEDVLNMPIPILGDDIKQDVVAKVNESASLRRQSKQLLEYAKQAVEMAIEQGEDAALVWLKERSGE